MPATKLANALKMTFNSFQDASFLLSKKLSKKLKQSFNSFQDASDLERIVYHCKGGDAFNSFQDASDNGEQTMSLREVILSIPSRMLRQGTYYVTTYFAIHFQFLLGCFNSEASKLDLPGHVNFQFLLGCFHYLLIILDEILQFFFQFLLGCFLSVAKLLLFCHAKTFNSFQDASTPGDVTIGVLFRIFQFLLGCFRSSLSIDVLPIFVTFQFLLGCFLGGGWENWHNRQKAFNSFQDASNKKILE